jgi:hypothetical protein
MPAFKAGIRLAMHGDFALLNTPRIMIRQRALEMSALTNDFPHKTISFMLNTKLLFKGGATPCQIFASKL